LRARAKPAEAAPSDAPAATSHTFDDVNRMALEDRERHPEHWVDYTPAEEPTPWIVPR
ncbi:MAG: hypothetical protein HY925_08610, partial [Elusimicrobia bacterium]|nr:hypothetical protein [Elusimicrobiota bacterium]